MINNSRLVVPSLLVCCLALPQKVNAQFFKKISKALETVDKVLSSSSDNQESQSATNKSSQDNSEQIHVATYGTDNAQFIFPHRTSKTKLITLDKDMPSISRFSEGAAYVFIGGEKGGFYIDTLGNKLFDFYASGVPPRFKNGTIIYLNRSIAYGLNKKGEIIFQIPKVLSLTDFSDDGIAAVTIGIPSKQIRGMLDHINIFINTQGQQVFKNLVFNHTMENLKVPCPLKCGLAAFYNYQTKKWGYRDVNGKIIISAQFDDAKDFSNEVALVKVKDSNGEYKWGYINATGSFIINPIFSLQPGSFCNEMAPIRNKERKYFYIDKTGKIITKAFDSASEFHNGYATVDDNERVYIMDASLKYVSVFNRHCNSSDINWNGKDLYVGKSLVNEKGDVLIYYVSDYFTGEYAPCVMPSYITKKDKGCSGFINRKGEYIVEFVESEF